MAGNLGCVVVSVDGNEGSMDALRWALDNVKLRLFTPIEVPAFTVAIEAHQKRITDAILNHALQICAEKKANVKTQVVIGDPKEKICEVIENVHADLLVMGSRAFGPIKRMLWLIKHLGLEKELPLQWELTKTWIMVIKF
ncbi:uncharacterized protein [Gossypium hirsutum]|uniref:UspA domain-containing protein n=1 Tax=Gossypium hirsutum TaxID=3635 RepID=A0ABM3BL91_GOSHI|nr:uncharacterized protein LOC107944909 [Gossypium hirsutum]